jgi:hypothetical protein
LVAAGLGTAGCAQRQPSYILQASCDLPCWRGIIPGSTSVEEAIDNLQQIPEVALTSLSVREQGPGVKYASWVMGPVGQSVYGEIIAIDGTVSTICLSYSEVRLDDLLLAYGQPASVGGFYGGGEGHWRSVFIHFDQGALAILTDDGWPLTDKWRLRPSDRVKHLYFFQPESLVAPSPADWLLDSAMSPGRDAFVGAASPWRGFTRLTLDSFRR